MKVYQKDADYKRAYVGHGGSYTGIAAGAGGGVLPPPGCVPATGGIVQSGAGATTAALQPVYGLYNYGIAFNYYPQTDFGPGQKRITSLTFETNSFTPGYTVNNQELKLCHFSGSFIPLAPQADLGNVPGISDLTTVKTGLSQSLTSQLHTISFDNYFCYNGVDNLLLIWINGDGTWTSGYGTFTADLLGSKFQPWAMYKHQDPSPIPGSDTLTAYGRRLWVRWGI